MTDFEINPPGLFALILIISAVILSIYLTYICKKKLKRGDSLIIAFMAFEIATIIPIIIQIILQTFTTDLSIYNDRIPDDYLSFLGFVATLFILNLIWQWSELFKKKKSKKKRNPRKRKP